MNSSVHASDDLSILKPTLSNTELIEMITSSINTQIQHQGKIQTEPGIYLVGVKGINNSIEYFYDLAVSELSHRIEKKLHVDNKQAFNYLHSPIFKKTIVDDRRQHLIASTCATIRFRQLLNKGITLVYNYYLSNGHYLGQINVHLSACTSKL